MHFRSYYAAAFLFWAGSHAAGEEKTELFSRNVSSPSNSLYSINQTAYTLPQGETELGFGFVHHGLTSRAEIPHF